MQVYARAVSIHHGWTAHPYSTALSSTRLREVKQEAWSHTASQGSGGGGRLGPDLEPLSQWYPSRTPLLPNPFLPPPPCWVCPILLGLHLPQPLSEGGHHGSCVAA